MSKRYQDFFLFDILVAILKIEYVSSKFTNPQDLLHSFTDWDSVIREFEIIGEASNNLIKISVLDTKYRSVVDFRNVIIHEYFGIDVDEVWDIVKNDLQCFKEIILNIIQKIDNETKQKIIKSYKKDNQHLDFICSFLENL